MHLYFRILITDAEDLQKVAELSLELPNLETIVVTDYSATGLKRQAIKTYVGRITDDI
jgi:hypothetical protein